jgi:hypothetical protein
MQSSSLPREGRAAALGFRDQRKPSKPGWGDSHWSDPIEVIVPVARPLPFSLGGEGGRRPHEGAFLLWRHDAPTGRDQPHPPPSSPRRRGPRAVLPRGLWGQPWVPACAGMTSWIGGPACGKHPQIRPLFSPGVPSIVSPLRGFTRPTYARCFPPALYSPLPSPNTRRLATNWRRRRWGSGGRAIPGSTGSPPSPRCPAQSSAKPIAESAGGARHSPTFSEAPTALSVRGDLFTAASQTPGPRGCRRSPAANFCLHKVHNALECFPCQPAAGN